MAKSLSLLLVVFSSIILAGIYGIVHDQISYTISHEYYTKFKFIQFELVDVPEARLDNPRIAVSIVGFLATWWVGFWIGLLLGLVGLIHPTWRRMLLITFRAMVLTFVIAFLVGLLGLIYGVFVLSKRGRAEFANWYIPDNLIEFKRFIAVGSMHNFSYLGGVIGLLVAVYYSIRAARIYKKTLTNLVL